MRGSSNSSFGLADVFEAISRAGAKISVYDVSNVPAFTRFDKGNYLGFWHAARNGTENGIVLETNAPHSNDFNYRIYKFNDLRQEAESSLEKGKVEKLAGPYTRSPVTK
jgi:hypothetical protein